MKDVEKVSFDRENSSKRNRRRRRNMGLYGFIVIILVLGIGITVSCTFLFNINEIKVGGESAEYTVEQIIDASGIKMGDNLIRLDSSKAEKGILDNLLYIESADVERDFPSSLVINVEKCVPAFNISYEMGTLLVSRKGKILENSGLPDETLPIFYGYIPTESALGKNAVEEKKEDEEEKKKEKEKEDESSTTEITTEYDEQGRAIVIEFMNIMYSKGEANNIVSVDINDKSNIIVTFKDGNVFRMGNWNDIEYKLTLAEKVMSEAGAVGYLTMIGTNQCSFRSTEGSFSSNVVLDSPQNTTESTPQSTSESLEETDEEYNDDEYSEYEETTEESTYVDPYEEMFREHNEAMSESLEDSEESSEDEENDEYVE